MSRCRVVIAAGMAAGVATVLRRMIRELDQHGRLSRPTAAALDLLYVAHLLAVWHEAVDDRRSVPAADATTTAGIITAAVGVVTFGVGMGRFPTLSQVNAQGDDRLVTGGIYRYSRHPQYLGWTLVLAGVAIAGRSPRALLLALGYPAAVRIWVPHEEAHLERTFGDAYRRYRRTTARWLGPRRGESARDR